MESSNLARLIRLREGCGRAWNSHPGLVQRLVQVRELQGHEGCVNRIAWEKGSGRLLASGSDDCKVCVWNLESQRPIIEVNTEHEANIFGVDFLHGQENHLVTGAMDGLVIHHRLESEELHNHQVFRCHSNRVKHIVAAPDNPQVFWSASEDGTVRQFDLREIHPTDCQRNSCNNAIICIPEENRDSRIRIGPLTLLIGGLARGFKALSVNPENPMYLAAACSDQFVRVYDRRTLSLQRNSGQFTSPLCTLSPKHLKDLKSNHDIHSTFVKFSHDGRKILASYCGEQIYMFDWMNSVYAGDEEFSFQPRSSNNLCIPDRLLHFQGERASGLLCQAYKSKDSKDYTAAIEFSTDAVEFPNISFRLRREALSLRSDSLIGRNWAGDVPSAIQDCKDAVRLDPNHEYSHIRLLECLISCKRYSEAYRLGAFYCNQFPNLRKQIESLITWKTLNFQGSDSEDEEKFSINREFEDSGFEMRYIGACGRCTDIREVNFFPDDKYVVAGSDEGNVFIWETASGKLLNILGAGSEVVNCVQPHPYNGELATSGIESIIRVFSPGSDFKPRFCRNSSEVQSLLTRNGENLSRKSRSPENVFTALGALAMFASGDSANNLFSQESDSEQEEE